MEPGIEQREIRPGQVAPTPSFGATVAAAAASSVGTAIGGSLAVQGQRIIQKFRESRI